ncbi:glycosyltransferase WbuB [Bdellovibrio sp. ZAP7]|uniref:glycosyltransferase family 4 protein n=1 Tax=Bdellovibrio sp. ZAP7 TaxID=2231053 RepID=UPI00115920CA|nr:glycosyltransferase family 4 protein [Bdellovibrio sp. ZAP7]QDK45345.1 glycosyltransferase WbuB [Bdellovibrio sp. ZAP7]
MRVAIHSYVYYPESFLVNELAAELVARGYAVQAYTGLPNYPKGEFFAPYSLLSGPYTEKHEGVEIIRYPIVPRKKGFFWLALNYLSHLVSGLLCSFRLEKVDAHIVFATSPITTAIPAIIKARFTGAKVIIWLQDLWPESVSAVGALGRKSISYKIIGSMVRWIYKNTDVMLIQSPAFRSNLNEFGFKGKIVDVPNWAPSEIEQTKKEEPSWLKEFPQNELTITFAGNIGKAQAVSTVLSAANSLKHHQEIKFVFVGDGSQKEWAEKYVRDRELPNVIFFGRRAVADMPALFRRSSALLVSLSDEPIFSMTIPSKIQAYMAAGRPIVGCLNGAGADVIRQSGCGLVASALNSEELSQVILNFKNSSKDQVSEFAANGKSYYQKHFAKEVAINAIEGVLKLGSS